jgi:hypothetical protein
MDAIDADSHGLAAAIDLHHDAGFGALRVREEGNRQSGQKSRNNQTTHGEPRSSSTHHRHYCGTLGAM